MSQIQSGYNYNTTTNKIVTAENLNNHVNNAILLTGAISEQQEIEGSIDTVDKILLHDVGAGILVNASIQQLWNSLPTDLTITSLTTKDNEDIVIYKDESNTGNPKVHSLIDVHVGTPLGSEQIGSLSNWDSYPRETTGNFAYISVNNNIVNAVSGGTVGGSGISELNFGYKNDRQPTDQGSHHRGNRFYFYGHGTQFIGTDNLAEGFENEIHPVTVWGPLTVNYTPEEENTPALTVTGDVSIGGNLTIGGVEFQKKVYKEISNELTEMVADGGTQTPFDVWTSTETVGYAQVAIKLPPIKLGWGNGDNDGTMRSKIDIVAKEDGESVEHVIARWGMVSSGRPNGWLYALPVPWQELLTPSNVDLTNKKLTIRVWGDNDWGGDQLSVMPFSGFMTITSIASTGSAVVPTSYVSVTQVDSDNSTFDGGAPIVLISYNSAYSV